MGRLSNHQGVGGSREGEELKATNYSELENIKDGVDYLAPYGKFEDRIPADVKAAIIEKSKSITAGSFKVPYDLSETKSD